MALKVPPTLSRTLRSTKATESRIVICRDHSANVKRWATRSELRYAIGTWIERTSNRRRRQRALGRLTPVESELAFARQPAVAA